MALKIQNLKNKKLELVNKGDLSLLFIGVGSAFSKISNQTNFILIKGDDHVVIDCGTKTPQALYSMGIPVMNIENWIITHSHADHIGGLEEVILMNRFVKGVKTKLVVTEEYAKILWDYSLKGGSSFNVRTKGKYVGLDFYADLLVPKKLKGFDRDIYEYNIGKINAKLIRTKHVPDSARSWKDSFWSVAVLIDDRILFTCDMMYDKDFIDLCEKNFNVEYIFHDCQLFNGGVHASLDELKQLPAEIKKKMFLVHFGDNYKDFSPEKDGFAGFGKQMVYYNFK
ncbi:MAG: MBL fold metallo-hydrolase [Spirochaetes bacterium]|nr:MBL fold metallo-hydrolase [Spirochaetota bacterium]